VLHQREAAMLAEKVDEIADLAAFLADARPHVRVRACAAPPAHG
jgi:hypothetical protein